MKLSIHLRKEVADTAQAQQLVDIVAGKLEDQPEVEISASVNESIEVTPG